MSFYNMLFGMNPNSDQILASIGLTRADVGRFRDAYLDGEHIVIHTRNGGGNRECWHDANEWNGIESCKHEARAIESKEYVELTEEEAAAHPEYEKLNIFVGSKRGYYTGRMVPDTDYKCLEPNSENCGCTGCIISFRLPKHPLYVSDEDDDFDCTYADIRFKVPSKEAAEVLMATETASLKPNEKWKLLFDLLKAPQ